MKYEFHPNAEAEFIESVGFYESKRKEFWSTLLQSIEQVITQNKFLASR
jgi:hypothetical protein